MIIGALLLTIAFFLKDPSVTTVAFTYSSIFNIAFILITVGLVNIVWDLVGGEPMQNLLNQSRNTIRLLSDGEATGLSRVVSSSSAYGTSQDWLDVLRTARRQIDLQGYTLLVWTRSEDFGKTLVQLAESGVNIRLVFMHEDADHLRAAINETQIPQLTAANVVNEISAMTNYLTQLLSASTDRAWKGSIEYRKIRKGLILNQICRVDGKLLVIPYIYSANTSECPLFVIENTEKPLFKKFEKEFESMWRIEDGGKQ